MEIKDPVVTKILSQVINDELLGTPVYVREIRSEADAENCTEFLPLIYIWNEERARRTFSISINGSLVAALLEALCHRSDPQFITRRDEIMKVLSIVSRNSILETCRQLSCMPSDTAYFRHMRYNHMSKLTG